MPEFTEHSNVRSSGGRSGPSPDDLLQFLRQTNALNTDLNAEAVLSAAAKLTDTDPSARPMVFIWGCYALVTDCGDSPKI
jgi:hypothetical protein